MRKSDREWLMSKANCLNGHFFARPCCIHRFFAYFRSWRIPVGVLTFYFFLSIICLSIETTSRIKNVFTINPEINFLILYGDI